MRPWRGRPTRKPTAGSTSSGARRRSRSARAATLALRDRVAATAAEVATTSARRTAGPLVMGSIVPGPGPQGRWVPDSAARRRRASLPGEHGGALLEERLGALAGVLAGHDLHAELLLAGVGLGLGELERLEDRRLDVAHGERPVGGEAL